MMILFGRKIEDDALMLATLYMDEYGMSRPVWVISAGAETGAAPTARAAAAAIRTTGGV